jgi:hypothetical protein
MPVTLRVCPTARSVLIPVVDTIFNVLLVPPKLAELK